MYPSPHPGHYSGTAFLSFLGHGIPASRGLGKLGPAVLQPPPGWPTPRLLRYSADQVQVQQVQPKVGWEHSSAPSCRPFRISSFHELESPFKLTRASERRPSIAMYPCSTSAHLLLCVVDVTFLHAEGYQPCCPCSHVHLELGGPGVVCFSSRLQHTHTVQYFLPSRHGSSDCVLFSQCAPQPTLGEVGCRVPILVSEHTC